MKKKCIMLLLFLCSLFSSSAAVQLHFVSRDEAVFPPDAMRSAGGTVIVFNPGFSRGCGNTVIQHRRCGVVVAAGYTSPLPQHRLAEAPQSGCHLPRENPGLNTIAVSPTRP